MLTLLRRHRAFDHLAESPVAFVALGEGFGVAQVFGLQFAPAGQAGGVDLACLNRGAHGAAGFGFVSAIAEFGLLWEEVA